MCGRQWTDRHTAVVCRYFGFSDLPIGKVYNNSYNYNFEKLSIDLAHYSSENYGKGTGPVLMDFVNCTGSERRLWSRCTHFTHYHGCSHDDDVGVQCKPGIILCVYQTSSYC